VEGKVVMNQRVAGRWAKEINAHVKTVEGGYELKLFDEMATLSREGEELLSWRPLDPRLADATMRHAGPVEVFVLDTVNARLSALLIERGLIDATWLFGFDPKAYLELNPDVTLPEVTVEAALRHFLYHGIAELRPYSDDEIFDPEFYMGYYPELGLATPTRAYEDWIQRGRQAGRVSSVAALLRKLGLSELPRSFSREAYLAEQPALTASLPSVWRAFEHFVETVRESGPHGLTLAAFGDVIEGAATLGQIGRAFEERGDTARAIEFYTATHAITPELTRYRQWLADCYLRVGQVDLATDHYRMIIGTPYQDKFTFFNLVRSLISARRLRSALEITLQFRDTHPEMDEPRQMLRDIISQLFNRRRRTAVMHYMAGDRAAATRLMLDYRDPRLSPRDAERVIPRQLRSGEKPRILILGDPYLRQCVHYRITQKMEHLRHAGYDVEYVPRNEPQKFVDRVPFADMAIFYRVLALPEVAEAMAVARGAGLITFYEIDDVIFDAELFPDRLESYGGDLSADEHANLVVDTPLYRHAMELCDYGIASTSPLAERIATAVTRRKCFLHRNALGSGHLRFSRSDPPDRGKDQPVSIFYGSGTKAHAEDFETLVAPALARLLEKYPTLRFVAVGYVPLPAVLGAFADRIDRLPPIWDENVYWSLLAEVDINLAVLAPGPVNDCKSEIKWLEAAMLGLPSVVSPTANYRDVLTDGETALFAASADEWFDRLEALVIDQTLRRKIGRAAYALALANYDVPAMASSIDSILGGVWVDHGGDPPGPRRRPVIAIVNVFFPPQLIGGATRVVKDNVDQFIDRYGEEFDIRIFCAVEGAATPYEIRRYLYRGVTVTAVSHPMREGMDLTPFDPRMGEIFAGFLDHYAPDIVHFHCVQRLTASVVQAARMRNIPYFVTVHDAWWISDHQFLIDETGAPVDETSLDTRRALLSGDVRWVNAVARVASLSVELSGAEAVLAVSEDFARTYRRFNVRNVRTIENGVSPRLHPVPKAPGRGLVRLGHIGGTQAHKGLPLIRRALLSTRLRNLELVVVDLSLPARTEGRREVWGATPVQFIGKYPAEQVGELYARFDVLLAPSIWPESYGLVTREALQHGLWVVASDRGAIGADITQGKNGFVVDVAGARDLARALAEIDADPRRYMAPPAFAPLLRTVETQTDELASLYRETLARTAALSTDLAGARA
jgi:glycosyltransferase involved in cell wall biosynthesis/tetratricopeptide (TPR) repeat protein